MVKIWFWLGLFLLPIQVSAQVKVIPQQLKMGETVKWVLKGDNIEADFAKLDLDKVRQNFKIYDVTGDRDYIRLVLLPLRTGQLKFPAFDQGEIQFAGASIAVAENPEVNIQWQLNDTKLFVSEWGLWRMDVLVSNPAFEIKQQLPDTAVKLPYRWLAEAAPVQQVENQGQKSASLLFAFTPNEKQRQIKVAPPIVEIKNTTNRRWFFAAENIYQSPLITVQNKPSFFPPDILVSKPSVKLSPLSWFAVQDDLQSLQWSITANTGDLFSLPDLASLYTMASPDTNWFFAEETSQSLWQKHQLVMQKQVVLPFRAPQFGFWQLPSIQVPYLDAETGKVAHIVVPAQTQLVLPLWLWVLLWLLMIALFARYVLSFAKRQIFTWRRQQIHIQALIDLDACDQGEELWQWMQTLLLKLEALYLVEGAEQMTLLQWQQRMSALGYSTKGLESLEKALFSEDTSGQGFENLITRLRVMLS